MSKLLFGLLGLLLVLAVGLAAFWLVAGVPPTAVPRLISLPPGASVRVELHSLTSVPPQNSLPAVRIGDTRIRLYGPPVDGITWDDNGLVLPAVQFARLEGQMVIELHGYERFYGPLDGSHITQDEHGQYVLRLDEQLRLTLQLRRDELRAVQAGVTNTQTTALLDQAMQHFAAAVNPVAWRDGSRLQLAGGEQVFMDLQGARASLQSLMDDPSLVESLGEDGRGRSTVHTAARDLLRVGRGLASAAITEAQSAGAPEEGLREADTQEWEGFQDEMQDRPEALQHFLAAWQLAVQAMPPATPAP